MRSKEIETQEEMLMNCRFEATGLKKVFKKKKKTVHVTLSKGSALSKLAVV